MEQSVGGRCRERETLFRRAMRSSPRNDKWTLLNRELSYRAAINIAPDKVTNLKEIQYKSHGNSIGDLIRAELSLAAETPLITRSSFPPPRYFFHLSHPLPPFSFLVLRALHLSHISRYYETWKFKWTRDNGAARCPKTMPDSRILAPSAVSPFLSLSLSPLSSSFVSIELDFFCNADKWSGLQEQSSHNGIIRFARYLNHFAE